MLQFYTRTVSITLKNIIEFIFHKSIIIVVGYIVIHFNLYKIQLSCVDILHSSMKYVLLETFTTQTQLKLWDN